MLEFISANWLWILLIGGMVFMHLGHGGHGGQGGHGGCGSHGGHSGHSEHSGHGSRGQEDRGSSDGNGDRVDGGHDPHAHHVPPAGSGTATSVP